MERSSKASRRAYAAASLPACALVLCAFLSPLHAQNAPEDAEKPPETLKNVEKSLEKSSFEQKRLNFELETLAREAQALRLSLVESAKTLREAEEKAQASERALKDIQSREAVLRRSLAARERVLAEVLAAMQRIGNKPPPALLVAPEDVLQAIRAAILFGAVLPDMRDEALILVADLKTLVELRQQAQAETATLVATRDSAAQERARLATSIEARQKQMAQSRLLLEGERTKAATLAREAKSLRELIARSESEIEGAAQVSALARVAPAPVGQPQQLASLPAEGALLQPRRPFAEMKGAVSLPVTGLLARGFGSPDGFGGTERGVTIEASLNAVVTAPADARVHFAGPYRGYGHLVILNAGNGYHLVLAGMERLSVEIGQFVLSGEPIGFLGAAPAIQPLQAGLGGIEAGRDKPGTNSPLGTTRPALYVEFRKDGAPVDPSPWWLRVAADKARG